MTTQNSEPMDIEEFEGGIKPKIDQVVVRFHGNAAQTLERLKLSMGLPSREKVVVQAVELLISAQGKDVVLRDRHGYEEVFDLWKGN